MKTTFFVATMIALTAVSCSKTELSNDTPRMIGFSAETGKMTKAIQDNSMNVALTNSDFGVFSYSVTGASSSWGVSGDVTNPIMDNIQITNQSNVWKASNGTTYYWPNDVSTKLTFFAYSPRKTTEVKVIKEDGITITDYAVATAADEDLMVAEQATDMTYVNSKVIDGSVPLTFKHVLTQVLFTVKTDAPYADITFTITGLNLTKITSNGTYKQKATPNVWTAATAQATATYTYLTNGTIQTTGTTAVNLGTAKALLPQTLVTKNQTLNITYTISGTGVASETVTKSIDLTNATVSAWAPNMKVTYNLIIGLKGITFTPTVAPWTTPATNPDLTVQ